MSKTYSVSKLKDSANEISAFCQRAMESNVACASKRQRAICDLCEMLDAAEREITSGAKGEDFRTFAKRMRGTLHEIR